MAGKYYWLKERHNPQLKNPYWVAYGKITTKEAKAKESSLYGTNYMHNFSTKEDYENKIEELRKNGLMSY